VSPQPLLLFEEPELKTDSCCSVSVDPHFGQGAGSDISLAHLNASNLLPHFLHSYSYIGTVLLLSDFGTVDVVKLHHTI
jgi:hypothetical protein